MEHLWNALIIFHFEACQLVLENIQLGTLMIIDETLSANLVYQSDYEIGSTTPSDETMAKIMTIVMAW